MHHIIPDNARIKPVIVSYGISLSLSKESQVSPFILHAIKSVMLDLWRSGKNMQFCSLAMENYRQDQPYRL